MKKKSKRHASRDRNFQIQLNVGQWFGLALPWVWLLTFTVLLLWGISNLVTGLNSPVQKVMIDTPLKFVTKNEIETLVQPELKKNFFQLDLKKIRNGIQKHPWIWQVDVARRWPFTLYISLVEQQPMARWQKGFINIHGDVIDSNQISNLKALPLIDAEMEMTKTALQLYRLLSSIAAEDGEKITMLRYRSVTGINLILDSGGEFILGPVDYDERFRRGLQVWRTLEKTTGPWRLDARYENGVAVKFMAINTKIARH